MAYCGKVLEAGGYGGVQNVLNRPIPLSSGDYLHECSAAFLICYSIGACYGIAASGRDGGSWKANARRGRLRDRERKIEIIHYC